MSLMSDHGDVLSVVGQILEELRTAFVDEKPLGGRTKQPEHRGGLLVALDGFFTPDDLAVPDNTMVWCQVLRIYRSRSFPTEEPITQPCGAPMVVQLQIGSARCSANMDEHGNPPDRADLEREALILLDDAMRLELALCRAWKRLGPEDRDVCGNAAIGAFEPVGPEGGILSGVMTATFQIGG